MKTYWGSGCILHSFFGLGTKMEVINFTPGPLYPQERSLVLDRLCGPRSRSRHGGEDKNPRPQLGFEHPIIQPVAQRYTTEISRILYYR
jgi:hypothetical protein